MRIVPMPDHLHGNEGRVTQRPEYNAFALVLGGGSLGSDPDTTTSGDDREPVIDVACVLSPRSGVSRPQFGGGSPGPAIDEKRPLRYLAEPDRPAPSPGIVRRNRAVSALESDHCAGEEPAVRRSAQHCDVAQPFGQ